MALLAEIIPAYLYRQYVPDDDLAALTSAYNAAAQYYLDWFNTVNLAYYPGLSGDLLDWIADGLYDQRRTSLASPASTALGPLNTVALNADYPLNSYTPSSQTLYSLTDDAFQRIITWNFYKGDGKRFSMRWLKRRIMRFLLGVNGTDPQGGVDGITVGTENTQAISVVVASHVLTVSINQVLLSKFAQLTPGILQIFQLAFQAGQSGPLELPLQYESYVCNIVTSLSATASPNAASSSGTATSQTTNICAIEVLGGSGSYTYAYSWVTGGTGITTNPLGSPSGSSVDFSASGMSPGTLSGVAQCLITDTVTSDTTTCQISVSITCYGALSASCTPTAASVTNATSTETTPSATVSITGGSGSFSVAWTWQSGGAGISPDHPVSTTTTWTATGLGAPETRSGVALCTVTDNVTSLQTTTTCNVSIARVSDVTASVTPSSASSSGTATSQTTNTVTASGSGGGGIYTFHWTWQSGGGGLNPGSPNSAATNWSATGMTPGNTYSGVAQCVVTDQYGQNSAPVTVLVSITCNPIPDTYSGSITSGSSGTLVGYALGAFGSISPTADTNGHTIEELTFDTSSGFLTLEIASASSLGSGYFANLDIAGTLFSSGSATYLYNSGKSSWSWFVSDPLFGTQSWSYL